jgi:hypothetical protein
MHVATGATRKFEHDSIDNAYTQTELMQTKQVNFINILPLLLRSCPISDNSVRISS